MSDERGRDAGLGLTDERGHGPAGAEQHLHAAGPVRADRAQFQSADRAGGPRLEHGLHIGR